MRDSCFNAKANILQRLWQVKTLSENKQNAQFDEGLYSSVKCGLLPCHSQCQLLQLQGIRSLVSAEHN